MLWRGFEHRKRAMARLHVCANAYDKSFTSPAQNGSSRKTADYRALNPYLARCAKCRGDVLHIANPSDRLSPRRQVELPVSRFDKKQTRCFCIGFAFYWSGLRGSNPPPPPWQGGALPNELNPRGISVIRKMATRMGLDSRANCALSHSRL